MHAYLFYMRKTIVLAKKQSRTHPAYRAMHVRYQYFCLASVARPYLVQVLGTANLVFKPLSSVILKSGVYRVFNFIKVLLSS